MDKTSIETSDEIITAMDEIITAMDEIITEEADWEYHSEYDPSVGLDNFWGELKNPHEVYVEMVKTVFPIYLKSICHKFAPNDESTWPNVDDDTYYLVKFDGGGFEVMEWFGEAYAHLWQNVTHYIDPDIFKEVCDE